MRALDPFAGWPPMLVCQDEAHLYARYLTPGAYFFGSILALPAVAVGGAALAGSEVAGLITLLVWLGMILAGVDVPVLSAVLGRGYWITVTDKALSVDGKKFERGMIRGIEIRPHPNAQNRIWEKYLFNPYKNAMVISIRYGVNRFDLRPTVTRKTAERLHARLQFLAHTALPVIREAGFKRTLPTPAEAPAVPEDDPIKSF